MSRTDLFVLKDTPSSLPLLCLADRMPGSVLSTTFLHTHGFDLVALFPLLTFKAIHIKKNRLELRHRHMWFPFPCFCPCPAFPFSSTLFFLCYCIQFMSKTHLNWYLSNHFSSPACACMYSPSCGAMAVIESLGSSGIYELLQLLCQHLRHCLDFLTEL